MKSTVSITSEYREFKGLKISHLPFCLLELDHVALRRFHMLL